MRAINTVLAVATLLIAVAPVTAVDVPIHYEVTFDATWSEETHPEDFPTGSAHFSGMVGGMHNANVLFWQLGELASTGIRLMAERGVQSTLANEITTNPNASSTAILGSTFDAPGTQTVSATATKQFSRITLVTMIAPTPDWFTGVSGLPLFEFGHWRENYVIDLLPFDAGTDSGQTYESANLATTPPEPIALIEWSPVSPGGVVVPVGRYKLNLVSVDGLPPHADFDGDGLENLREAELDSDPRSPDTDGDSIGDASDNCRLVSNIDQADGDQDTVGDFCDNCPGLPNPGQIDTNQDSEGDRCDLNDGLLYFVAMTPASQAWQNETVYDTFNLYRGDLDLLRSNQLYTQDPSAALADRFCGWTTSSATDGYLPPVGGGVFYLVTGVDVAESSLGFDSSGNERPNLHACP
jgi:hypothetical protein